MKQKKKGREREREEKEEETKINMWKKKILRKEIKGSSMQPTRSVGGIPSGDWMTEFPRRHSVVRRLNGFMEGLVRGELARIQKRASGGRLEMREILIKRRDVCGRGWRKAEFSHWSCKFHRIFQPRSLHVIPHLLKRYYEYSLLMRSWPNVATET